jgi:hypothetical protein
VQVKIYEMTDKNQQYKKNRKQRKTTLPGFTYLVDFFFKLKPPCQAEGFSAGMVAEKTSSPSHARNGVIDN